MTLLFLSILPEQIVPGCIGGRTVKWLRRVVVSESEVFTNRHYLFFYYPWSQS